MNYNQITTFLLVVTVMLVFFVSCEEITQNQHNDQIVIGALLPYSGSMATYGTQYREALELATFEINKNGGILGKEIELLVKDMQTDPQVALKQAEELVRNDVVAIIGAITSSATIAVAQNVSIKANKLLICPASTSVYISSVEDSLKTDLVFRTIISDAVCGELAAQYALKTASTAGIVFIDNAYGKGLADCFKNEYEKNGGKVINYVSYPELTSDELNAYDFSSTAKSLFKNKPEMIYFISFVLDGALLTHAAKDYISDSYRPLIIGCDGNRSDEFLINASPFFIDGMFNIVSTPMTESAEYEFFRNNYTEKYAKSPGNYAENAYDVIYLLALAMLEANSTLSVEIAKHLRTVSQNGQVVTAQTFDKARQLIQTNADIDYQGASGNLIFDSKGDITQGVYGIYKIENLKFELLETIKFNM